MTLGVFIVLYRGCEQLVILVGIGDFDGIEDYSLLEIITMLYGLYDLLIIFVGFRHLNENWLF